MHEVQQYHSKDESPPNRTPCPGRTSGAFSSVAVLTRRWGRAALESTSAAMHTSLARCSHAAHGRTRAGPWPRLGHVARDPVAGRAVDRRPAVARRLTAAGIV